ncbi:MAG: hypothetical protein L0Y72_05655 [Gemmataceae bacterium]|nr:hypothetical protein [Gemmataceae bacterium]MCI0738510.1 hypothetical protein [Gemmataceae bacterium]
MRRIIAFSILAVSFVIVFSAPSMAQFGKKGKGGGQFGFGGGMQFGGGQFGGGQFGGMQMQIRPGGAGGMSDPGVLFDQLSKGRGFFLVNDTRTLREPLTRYLQEKGITNGQVTRDQFTSFMSSMTAGGGFNMMRGPQGGGGPNPGMGRQGGFSGGGIPGGGAMFGGAQMNPVDALSQWADSDFKFRDRNGDGFLNMDEMSDQLKVDLGRWDFTRDNLIDVEEYKAFFVTRFQEGRGRDNQLSPNPIAVIIEEEIDWDKRPDVLRAGKLDPKVLPDWFMKLDTDRDGQVALYEWRRDDRRIEEFAEWDRDDDGLITPEEAISKHRQSMVARNGDSSESPSMFTRFSENGANPWAGKGKKGGDKGKKGNDRSSFSWPGFKLPK